MKRTLSELRLLLLMGCLLAGSGGPLGAQSWLEHLDDSLFLQSRDGAFRADVSGLLDLEGYFVDQRPPGLVFSDDRFFFNPRLYLFADIRLGRHWHLFAQMRADRGFDPGADVDGDVRAEEYLLRWTPLAGPALNLQAGKFATVTGSWVRRHLSWNNPFINAPGPYETVTVISDATAPAGPAALLGRKGTADKKAQWLPVLWGPAYTAGGAIFGAVERWDYALEIKNAQVSSRPTVWSPTETAWDDPTLAGRIGFRPNAAWNVGASLSVGTYLTPDADATLPVGRERGDYLQYLAGVDASYARRHWQFWAEMFLSRFEVPNVGDAETLAYYMEAKYKFTPELYVAVRWNQQFFGDVRDGLGGREPWDNDFWRMDAALGWRFDRHAQAKLQYSYSHQRGNQQQGEQLVAAQLTMKF
jgi:hypothetical protein